MFLARTSHFFERIGCLKLKCPKGWKLVPSDLEARNLQKKLSIGWKILPNRFPSQILKIQVLFGERFSDYVEKYHWMAFSADNSQQINFVCSPNIT